MRNKILEIMKNFDNHDKLYGIIEKYETYTKESQKMRKNITRQARKKVIVAIRTIIIRKRLY